MTTRPARRRATARTTNRREAGTVPMVITLARGGPVPLHRQIYGALRAAILARRLAPGARLPSTRILAADLRVSRTTVLSAYDQLASEGFVTAHGSGGSRVANVAGRAIGSGPRATTGRHARHGAASSRKLSEPVELSAMGAAMRATYPEQLSEAGIVWAGVAPRRAAPVAVGIPALDAFPTATWARLTARCWRRDAPAMMLPDDGHGYRPLREAIADYVVTARAVRCTADQVIVTAGAQQAIDLTARLLLNPGDQAWMEEPGFLPARAAFVTAGATMVEVPVDADGLDVAAGRAAAPNARLAFVTPSFQAPLGVVMSLRRRLALLDWAEEARAWILEDDYNGEFRYDGHPLAAMQGLEHPGAQRVIFVGTFSKTLFPSLRLGYAVVPPGLVDAFALARLTADRHSPVIEQAVLADFIGEGHFARHMRRMRRLYAERQRLFVAIARRELGALMRVDESPAGMRLLGWLPPGVSDRRVAAEAARRGVTVVPLSSLRLGHAAEQGLLLGYAPFTATEMRRALRTLAEVVRAVRTGA
jgi:GntR family transcriptional regulator / MocR family aminotransferase